MPDQKIPPLPVSTIQISFEEWVEKFQPVVNVVNSDAAYNGTMFETFGDELDYVQAVRDKHPYLIWTITSSGDYTTLGDGYHYVDREGYFITAIPCPGNESYEIVLGEPDDDQLEPGQALEEIHAILDGSDWSPDTFDEIVDVMRRAGYVINDIPEDT